MTCLAKNYQTADDTKISQIDYRTIRALLNKFRNIAIITWL